MNKAQFKMAIAAILFQLVLLAGTLGFHAGMDVQAERTGISQIIQEAGQ